ncbi:MAG TPA: tetratricopeptide repeat protein [Vicinamibacterales bacterium]
MPSRVFFPPRELPVAGRPFVNLSFAMNYAIGGLDVRVYHLTNIAIHLACALLLFGLVRRTLSGRKIARHLEANADGLAFTCALIWVLHPLNSEAVDYLTERTESMMALFYLLTLYASVRALAFKHRVFWQAVAVASSALGMGCKESMITVPLMVLLYDRTFAFDSWKDSARARWKLYTLLAATWIELAALVWAGPRGHSAGWSTDVRPWTYLLNQSEMIVRYLGLSVFPRRLIVNYGFPRPLALTDVLPYVAVVILLLAAAGAALVKRPKAGFLGLWFFLTLAPTTSIVPIATEVGAERRMYLPLAAIVVLAVVSFALVGERLLFARGRTRLRAAVLAAVAAVLAAATIVRNREYASALTLAQTVLDRQPGGVGHYLVGTELLAVGRRDEGVAHLREALGQDPRASYALGVELYREGKLADAVAALQEFIRDQPELLEVISARMLIGRAYTREGKLRDAADVFARILTMVPSYTDAEGGLADALFAGGRLDEAIAHYREFLRVHPEDFAALTKVGVALAETGHPDQALVAFRAAVRVDPTSEIARRNLELAEAAAKR